MLRYRDRLDFLLLLPPTSHAILLLPKRKKKRKSITWSFPSDCGTNRTRGILSGRAILYNASRVMWGGGGRLDLRRRGPETLTILLRIDVR